MTKNKQKDNPKFGFLFGGEHFNYYQYKVTTEQASKWDTPINSYCDYTKHIKSRPMLYSTSKGMTLKSDTESDSPSLRNIQKPIIHRIGTVFLSRVWDCSLFVKQKHFYPKDILRIPWQWRFLRRRSFKILAGVCLT